MSSKILLVFGLAIVGIGSAAVSCDLKGDWASACQAPELIGINDAMKKALIDLHNKYRNEIALGKIEHYDQAANMATIDWDDGLAARAVLNVHQCEMKHDDCMGTDKFLGAGQNIVMAITTGDQAKTPAKITDMAKVWFDEQKKMGRYGWMDNMKKLTNFGDGDHEVCHFTQFVWSKANRIGCAISTSKVNKDDKNNKGKWTIVTCNYSCGNVVGAEVYEPGTATSKCKTGKNKGYPGLCSTNEKYE